jgi:hypothetical protein
MSYFMNAILSVIFFYWLGLPKYEVKKVVFVFVTAYVNQDIVSSFWVKVIWKNYNVYNDHHPRDLKSFWNRFSKTQSCLSWTILRMIPFNEFKLLFRLYKSIS